MLLRTLYLHSLPAADRRDDLSGCRLWEEFRARSSGTLVGQRVLPAGKTGEARKGLDRAVLSEGYVRDLGPNLICMEGGLFADNREPGKCIGRCWKVWLNAAAC